MKKTFQKTLIAAAAGVALMSAAGTASANSLLFPYFTTATGASSILSLSMGYTAGVANVAVMGSTPPSATAFTTSAETLHYVYNYGSACTHYDGSGSMSANDVMQHSVASVAQGGFGKVVGTDKSTPFYFPLKDYGFLTVSTKSSTSAKITGEIIVYDPSNGLVVSMPGIDNQIADTTGASEGDFSATQFRDTTFNLTTYPSALVTTSWYGIVVGNMNSVIAANTNWGGKATFTNNGIAYDNDENPFSGAAAPVVTCAGILTPSSFMTTAQASAVGTNGSLVHATATGSVSGTGIWMNKLQVIPVAGFPGGKVGLMHKEQGLNTF